MYNTLRIFATSIISQGSSGNPLIRDDLVAPDESVRRGPHRPSFWRPDQTSAPAGWPVFMRAAPRHRRSPKGEVGCDQFGPVIAFSF